MEAFGLLLLGFKVLFTWKTILLMLVGLALGTFVGVLPGLVGPNGVEILLPITFFLPPIAGQAGTAVLGLLLTASLAWLGLAVWQHATT